MPDKKYYRLKINPKTRVLDHCGPTWDVGQQRGRYQEQLKCKMVTFGVQGEQNKFSR